MLRRELFAYDGSKFLAGRPPAGFLFLGIGASWVALRVHGNRPRDRAARLRTRELRRPGPFTYGDYPRADCAWNRPSRLTNPSVRRARCPEPTSQRYRTPSCESPSRRIPPQERNGAVTRLPYALVVTTPPSISVEPPHAAGVTRLLEAGSSYSRALYPAGDGCLQLDAGELTRPGVTVYVARDDDGTAVGMIALIDDGAHGAGRAEIARMYVDEPARGTGIASRLLDRVETDASARGIRELVLQTGTQHLPAQALYAKHGYRRVAPFGRYVGTPASICMAKSLVGFGADLLDERPLAVGE
ncbi:GNAT family N-acetyltransferase [Agromyces binzhouensis]|uniref:GNAT family N-acetyltransferase n=1 Tax=Agromyces binzhouensis TaxID=1817495 RepID=A0A4Q2J5Q0_9MICO|nr:GNAT family N-acetyltransferase [Agromyces binzhouensis]